MDSGDTVRIASAEYKGSEGTTCADNQMFLMVDLSGSIVCSSDDADCVLDGESSRGVIYVMGTGSGKLTLRALTFQKGKTSVGGGGWNEGGAVIIELCLFTNCGAISSYDGGGAIAAIGSSTTMNIYGTLFSGNTADSGNGNDIYGFSGGDAVVHLTCPSPYEDKPPVQGAALDVYGPNITGPLYSYSGCADTADLALP